MPEFLPFVGTRFDSTRVDLSSVVAPPYDVISPDEREVLYARDPHNVIRLILNRDADPYAGAMHFLSEWLRDGTLIRESAPRFYVYYQVFRTIDGVETTRMGVIGRLALSRYEEGQIRPHERTLAGPKKDRLQLMEAVRANLSPIFGLIDDPTILFDNTLAVATANPAMVDVSELLANGETVRHLLWTLDDEAASERIRLLVDSQRVTIADGHHRYETSLAFRDAHPEIQGATYVMTYLSNIRSEGTIILPTHRALYGLEAFDEYDFLKKMRDAFELVAMESEAEGMNALENDPHAITFLELDDNPHFLLVRERARSGGSALERLPVVRLQEEILKPIAGLSQDAIDQKTNLLYPHTLHELEEHRKTNKIQAAFLLRPVSPAEMVEVAREGAFMPQKSTFFYPKLLSGLVFHEFGVQLTR